MVEALRGGKVLVVDDDRRVCEMIADGLDGCDVETAATHDAARKKLAGGRFDVAILDIMGVSGFELLAEFGGNVPCIMLTARALKPQDLERAVAGGAALFLPKEELAFLDEYVEKVILARGSREAL